MEDTASLTLECLLFLEMKGWQAVCSLEGNWAWLCPLDSINELKSEFRPCEQNTRDPACWLPLASCVSLGKVLSLSGLPIKMILQLRIREPTLVCGSHSGWAQEGTLLYILLQQRCCRLRSADSSRALRAQESLVETLSTPRGTW